MSSENDGVRIERSLGGGLTAVSPSGARLTIRGGRDEDPASGGWRPTELLLAALGGCMTLDVATILEKQRHSGCTARITVRPGRRDDSLPARAFQSLRVEQEWTGPMTAAVLERAVALAAARYCTVQLTLEQAVRVEHAVELQAPGATDESIE
ncbi:MAG: OsmC family protein [Candidatus Dormibacteria bacterium]